MNLNHNNNNELICQLDTEPGMLHESQVASLKRKVNV